MRHYSDGPWGTIDSIAKGGGHCSGKSIAVSLAKALSEIGPCPTPVVSSGSNLEYIECLTHIKCNKNKVYQINFLYFCKDCYEVAYPQDVKLSLREEDLEKLESAKKNICFNLSNPKRKVSLVRSYGYTQDTKPPSSLLDKLFPNDYDYKEEIEPTFDVKYKYKNNLPSKVYNHTGYYINFKDIYAGFMLNDIACMGIESPDWSSSRRGERWLCWHIMASDAINVPNGEKQISIRSINQYNQLIDRLPNIILNKVVEYDGTFNLFVRNIEQVSLVFSNYLDVRLPLYSPIECDKTPTAKYIRENR